LADKLDAKDLETVLARLKHEWQELVDLLTSQGRTPERIIEVEKILFRDAAGCERGKISANPDGSADLILSGSEGGAWVRLGVDRDGEAFLELKDKKGESSFKVAVGASFTGTGKGPAAPSPDTPGAEAELRPGLPGEPESSPDIPISTPASEPQPGGNAELSVVKRLEKLENQNRRRKIYETIIWGALAVILLGLAYALFCPYRSFLSVASLTVRDPKGQSRAFLGLGPQGAPYLAFYDREQRLRAELKLEEDGEPHFTLRDRRSLQGQAKPGGFSDSAPGRSPGGTGAGVEEGTMASPSPAPAAGSLPQPQVEGEDKYVGSKTSNKYHYPTCKFVRWIFPGNMIKFKSEVEAQGSHYIPCPVCKPPPLSR
jgi:hypothetical protein